MESPWGSEYAKAPLLLLPQAIRRIPDLRCPPALARKVFIEETQFGHSDFIDRPTFRKVRLACMWDRLTSRPAYVSDWRVRAIAAHREAIPHDIHVHQQPEAPVLPHELFQRGGRLATTH